MARQLWALAHFWLQVGGASSGRLSRGSVGLGVLNPAPPRGLVSRGSDADASGFSNQPSLTDPLIATPSPPDRPGVSTVRSRHLAAPRCNQDSTTRVGDARGYHSTPNGRFGSSDAPSPPSTPMLGAALRTRSLSGTNSRPIRLHSLGSQESVRGCRQPNRRPYRLPSASGTDIAKSTPRHRPSFEGSKGVLTPRRKRPGPQRRRQCLVSTSPFHVKPIRSGPDPLEVGACSRLGSTPGLGKSASRTWTRPICVARAT